MAKLIEEMVRFCVKFGSALIIRTKVPSLKNKYHKFEASNFFPLDMSIGRPTKEKKGIRRYGGE